MNEDLNVIQCDFLNSQKDFLDVDEVFKKDKKSGDFAAFYIILHDWICFHVL